MILIACGLQREARIMARTGLVVAGGGDARRLEQKLEAVAADARAILSSGIAGAVAPGLKAGDVVIDGDLVQWLAKLLPEARVGTVVGSDRIVTTGHEKYAIHTQTGALAVDMETHVARRVAARHGLPLGIVRTISDAADETLPPAALVGMRPDGGMALGAVLASLARHPAQLPALIRTGLSAGRAFRSLERCHDVLRRGGIGDPNLLEFALDM